MVRRMLAGLFKGFPGAAGIRQGVAVRRDWESVEQFLRDALNSMAPFESRKVLDPGRS
jgi:hypothetical protein